MPTYFDAENLSENALNQYADALSGIGGNAQSLNGIVGQLINSVCQGISDNDTCLNKILGVIKAQLTRAVNANAANLATVTQPLQTALTASAGELAAQTNLVASAVAASTTPTPTTAGGSAGGGTNAIGGSDDGEFTPVDKQQYILAGGLLTPTQAIMDTLDQNADVLQKVLYSAQYLGLPTLQLGAGTPIGKWLYQLVQPDGVINKGLVVAADKPLKKGLVNPPNLDKKIVAVVLPAMPVYWQLTPVGGGSVHTGGTTGTGGGFGGVRPVPISKPILTPSPPTLPKPLLPFPPPSPPGGGQQPTPTPPPTPTPQPPQQPTPTPTPQPPLPVSPFPPPPSPPTPTPTPQPFQPVPPLPPGSPPPPPSPPPSPSPISSPTLPYYPTTGTTGGRMPINPPIFPTPVLTPSPPSLPPSPPVGYQPTLPYYPTTGTAGGGPPRPRPIPPPPVFTPSPPTIPPPVQGGGFPPLPPIPGLPPPPIGTSSPPSPIQQPSPPYYPPITVSPQPGGSVTVVVQQCCKQGSAQPTSEEQQPPQPSRVRVAGAGDERPDDVAVSKDCQFSCTAGNVVPFTLPDVDFCSAMDIVYGQLVSKGQEILECAGDGLGLIAYKTLAMFWWKNPDVSYSMELVKDMCLLLSENKRSGWHFELRSIIISWPLADREAIYPLLAVKRMLEELDKIAIEWGKTAHWGVNLHSALGLEAAGLGVSTGETGAEDSHLSVAKGLHPVITYGLEIVEKCLKFAQRIDIPAVGELLEAYKYNTINDKAYSCYMSYNGARTDVFAPVLASRRERIEPEEFIQWSRRLKIDDAITQKALRDYGFIYDNEAAQRMLLYDELPTISDHLHWLQRNVFDDDYVRDYDLLQGFEDRFWVKFGADLRALGMKKDYASLHYAAHWINPSPGQLFEMLRRLRPGRVDKSVEFTETDLLRLLAEQDVAPYFRQRFREIAYVPFGLRFMRQLYDTRQIDDNEASQRFQDLGYKKEDADLLVNSERIRRARTIATQTRGYTVANIQKLYMAGRMQTKEAITRLEDLGYPDESGKNALAAWSRIGQLKEEDNGKKAAKSAVVISTKDAVQLGVVTQAQAADTLVRVGFSTDNATSLVTSWITMDRIRITKTGIAQIKKGVMSGQLALADASPLLMHLGLSADKINEYTNIWQYDLQAGKKFLAAGQITKLLEEGLIDAATARSRLANLNYADPDAILLIAEANYRIQQNEIKVATAEQKSRQTHAKELLAAINKNKQQLARMQKQLTGLGSVKTLTTWYRSGLIGPIYLRARLEAMGYQDSDITLLIEEANIEGATKRGTQAVTPVNPGVGTTGKTPGAAGS